MKVFFKKAQKAQKGFYTFINLSSLAMAAVGITVGVRYGSTGIYTRAIYILSLTIIALY